MRRDSQLARDAWIAIRCKLGEPGAFEDLVGELERPLLYYVTKLTGDGTAALDVLQEVWISVFRTIGALHDPPALRTWVYRIARGKALNRVRDDATRRRAEQGAAESEQVSGSAEPHFDVADVEALHRCLDMLEDKHREVLVLHFLEEWSIEEIAEIVEAPPGTVKSRIHHAKRDLARRLESERHAK